MTGAVWLVLNRLSCSPSFSDCIFLQVYQMLDGCLRGDNNGRTLIGIAKRWPWLLSQLFRITHDLWCQNVFGYWVFLLHQSKSEGWVLSAPLQFLCFSLLSIILADLLANRILLQQVQKGHCDWWILIRFVCFFVSRFTAFELQLSRVFTLFLALKFFYLLTETWQVYIPNVKLFL